MAASPRALNCTDGSMFFTSCFNCGSLCEASGCPSLKSMVAAFVLDLYRIGFVLTLASAEFGSSTLSQELVAVRPLAVFLEVALLARALAALEGCWDLYFSWLRRICLMWESEFNLSWAFCFRMLLLYCSAVCFLEIFLGLLSLSFRCAFMLTLSVVWPRLTTLGLLEVLLKALTYLKFSNSSIEFWRWATWPILSSRSRSSLLTLPSLYRLITSKLKQNSVFYEARACYRSGKGCS